MPSPFVNLLLDVATETTLALVRTAVDAINAKLPADPATVTAQGVGNASLASLDGKVTECDTGAVVVASSALPADAATQTTLAAVLAKIIAAPATEAKQDTGNTSAATTATQTTTTATNTGTLAGIVTSGAAIVKPKAGLSYNSAALERSCVASATAASPAMARMWNAGASSRFLQGHDASSLPGNGAIPNDVVNAGATSPCFINFVTPTDAYGTGVVFACSTTAATLTITGANDALFSIHLFASES